MPDARYDIHNFPGSFYTLDNFWVIKHRPAFRRTTATNDAQAVVLPLFALIDNIIDRFNDFSRCKRDRTKIIQTVIGFGVNDAGKVIAALAPL